MVETLALDAFLAEPLFGVRTPAEFARGYGARLRWHSAPVIDREGLAGHRGSVFGYLGLPPQPSHLTLFSLLLSPPRR